MARERQVSFAGGEVSPTLYGRTDMDRYPVSLRKCKNFIPTQHGILVNRTGLQHVAKLSADQYRLVPFDRENYRRMIALRADNSVRDRGVFIYEPDSTDPRFDVNLDTELKVGLSVTTGISSDAILERLRYTQVGNILTFVHGATQPKELVYDPDADSWTLRNLSFDPETFPWQGSKPFTDITGADVPSLGTDDQYPSGPQVLDNILFRHRTEHNFPHIETDEIAIFANEPLFFPQLEGYRYLESDGSITNDARPAREWDWIVTYLIYDTEADRVYETLGYKVRRYFKRQYRIQGRNPAGELIVSNVIAVVGSFALPDKVSVYATSPVNVNVGVVAGSPLTSDSNKIVISARVYRGREGRYGFLGETKKEVYVDDGATPDFSDPPPGGGSETAEESNSNPFKIYQSGSLLREEYPRVVAFHEGRRYFANTEERPSTVWASSVEDYRNFEEVIPPDDADALEFTLQSNRDQVIRSLISGNMLVGLSSNSEWLLRGSGQANSLITPNSLPLSNPPSNEGSAENPTAIDAKNTIFFPHKLGTAPMAMRISPQGISVNDTALLSRHLFDGFTIKDWAFAEFPYPVLWVVRSDGLLLSLTYEPDQQILAWARHPMVNDGEVESVATLPGDKETEVYLMVKRGADEVRFLERFAYHILPNAPLDVDDPGPDLRFGVYLDRAVTYNGQVADTTRTCTLAAGATTAIGDDITVTLSSVAANSGLTGTVIQIDDPAGGVPIRIELGAESPAYQYAATILVSQGDGTTTAIPAALLSTALTKWWICKTSIGGLDHLEGESITVVADGNLAESVTVEGGGVDLTPYTDDGGAAIAHAGVGYNSDMETLDVGMDRTVEKVVKSVVVELDRSRGGVVGESLDREDELYEISGRQLTDEYETAALQRIEEEVNITGTWNKGGRVAVRQDKPFAIRIIGVTRDIEVGGT